MSERSTADISDELEESCCCHTDDCYRSKLKLEAAARLRAQADQLKREKLMRESSERYVERLAICPDHRDKATGRCVVCQAEDRTRQEVRRDMEARLRALEDEKAMLMDAINTLHHIATRGYAALSAPPVVPADTCDGGIELAAVVPSPSEAQAKKYFHYSDPWIGD